MASPAICAAALITTRFSTAWSTQPNSRGGHNMEQEKPAAPPVIPPVPKSFKILGKNYVTPDLVAKVTGRAKYAEDFRAEGMVFIKLMPSPRPHARVVSIDASAALAMPGVHGMITADDLPAPTPPPAPPAAPPAPAAQGGVPAAGATGAGGAAGAAGAAQGGSPAPGQQRPATPPAGATPPAAAPAAPPMPAEFALTMEPVYEGEPILGIAADSEELAAEAIDRIVVTFEALPHVIDPLDSLRPGGPNGRSEGN